MLNRRRKGFTLIELLIVVAIIAILAAIAVPNFLEAQVRAKVSRAKNDMRSIATALEAYRLDYNIYPPDGNAWNTTFGVAPYRGLVPYPNPSLVVITTPVAYMTSVPREAFSRKWVNFWQQSSTPVFYDYGARINYITVQEMARGQKSKHEWVLSSVGPDQLPGGGTFLVFGLEYVVSLPPRDITDLMATWGGGQQNIYDATNGTMSPGDIARVGP